MARNPLTPSRSGFGLLRCVDNHLRAMKLAAR
jgi:hypothetical protein